TSPKRHRHRPTFCPYTTLFRSRAGEAAAGLPPRGPAPRFHPHAAAPHAPVLDPHRRRQLPLRLEPPPPAAGRLVPPRAVQGAVRSEEHTSELQSLAYLVCRLLL